MPCFHWRAFGRSCGVSRAQGQQTYRFALTAVLWVICRRASGRWRTTRPITLLINSYFSRVYLYSNRLYTQAGIREVVYHEAKGEARRSDSPITVGNFK